ncbi:MerR family transcriptional regulator [Actinocatenispora rupis]|uniref:MerR family transcriptional regulator n=1 Tax=Actinocatenispora rupis TaxID=519421 RepID=A0A8J3J385_9ACTN|nr:MerR family transcriptional regulator [Actinocatenispora rupis]GID11290.1 MerR family transcriptional regulator [Actinocatenispora rupis]
MTDYLTPAQVVERFSFSHDTLRYYERIGVLNPVRRSSSGHRRYAAADVELLDLVRCLRDTGMPVAAMRAFADLVRGGDTTIPDRIDLLADHDAQLAAHIDLLQERQRHIRHKIDWYRSVLAGDD